MENKKFYHNVYFWLNNPDSEEEKELFLASLKKFLDLSTYAGNTIVSQPAQTSRAVVDNSYTFSLMVAFNNKEQHDLYQTEQPHQDFVNEAGHLWKRVQVFDSFEIWNLNEVQQNQ
ncbi:Dabb family protein [Ochrovirga pacifica]|uniref:Dabb family protein n=1 Tax=Ochrovirga pacifica TaxID=1042376 RepID=UPI000255A7BE|nr:Dabb family protein [Ochrovirga pacifica]